MPKSLGETLSATIPSSSPTPRSVPIKGDVPKTNGNGNGNGNSLTDSQAGNTTMAPQEQKPQAGITFAGQDNLAKLPIPDLESTCQKYLAALRPLQSPREHSDTKHAVQEFLRHEGPELQEKLKKYAQGRTSYIEQFCAFGSSS